MIISSCFTNNTFVSCVMVKVTQADLYLIIYLKKGLMWLDNLVPASTAAVSPKHSTVCFSLFQKANVAQKHIVSASYACFVKCGELA